MDDRDANTAGCIEFGDSAAGCGRSDLRDCDVYAGLSDAYSSCNGDQSISKTATEGRDEAVLKELLESICVNADEAASRLINKFGSLAHVLAADPAARSAVLGPHPALSVLTVVRAAMMHALTADLRRGPLLGGLKATHAYLSATMACEPNEQVRVLYLDVRHYLIRDEIVTRGGVDSALIPIREIMRRALELGSSGLIIAHNHPSGSCVPSRQDELATSQLVQAGVPLDVTVIDHIVVARSGCTSMRAAGLMTVTPELATTRERRDVMTEWEKIRR